MIYQRKGDYRLRSIAGVEGVVDGAGCIEQGFTAYSVYPFNGVFRYPFLSAYIDRM